jgi:hypothetical protein
VPFERLDRLGQRYGSPECHVHSTRAVVLSLTGPRVPARSPSPGVVRGRW